MERNYVTVTLCIAKTHTHPYNGPLSGTTNLDFTEARDSELQWHQLGCMQVCTSLQRDNHASTPPLKIFTGRMPFLLPNQQHQSTEGRAMYSKNRPIKQKLWVEVQATNRLDVGRKMPCIQSQWRRLDTEFIHWRHAMHFPRLVDHAYTALHTAA